MTSPYSTFASNQPSLSSTWQVALEDLSQHLDALSATNAEAFELSQSSRVRQLLQKLEQQHAQYKFELDNFLNNAQTAVDISKLHHSWSNVRDTFTAQRAESDIIKECLRGELITLSKFDGVLDDSLPDTARAMLGRQRQGIAMAAAHLSQWTF